LWINEKILKFLIVNIKKLGLDIINWCIDNNQDMLIKIINDHDLLPIIVDYADKYDSDYYYYKIILWCCDFFEDAACLSGKKIDFYTMD
jgi:hypothetical protein